MEEIRNNIPDEKTDVEVSGADQGPDMTEESIADTHSEEENATGSETPDGNQAESDRADDDIFGGLIDPSKPLTAKDIRKVGSLIDRVGENVRIVQSIWNDTMREYNLTDPQMKALYAWNIQNRDIKPDVAEGEKEPEYDPSNGILKLTEEKITEIFGDEHPIYGVDHAQTIDRIKQAFDEFIECLTTLRHFKDVNNAYAVLQDEFEKQQIEELQKICDAETDPEKKKQQQDSINLYWDGKYLDFIGRPLDERDKKRMVEAFTDANRADYWLKRSERKLKQLKISPLFLKELYNFETVHMDEKYHRLRNVILIYFMHLITYCDCYDKHSLRRSQVVFMFNAIDAYAQNRLTEDVKNHVKANLEALLDQFMDAIPETEVGVLNG